MTTEDVSRLSDEELLALAEIVSEESKKRERGSAKFAKAAKAKAEKRDPRCPKCAAKLWRDGKRKDGVQTYVCPRLRQEVLRRERHLPRIVEDDDAADRENDNPDYAGLPELGGFLDTRNRSKNRSILEGAMLGR